VLSSDERPLEEEESSSPELWLDAIEANAASLSGVVLPLELRVRGQGRSQLGGIELLRWLRWSSKGTARLVPVLAVAWQPLEEILRRVPELLLVGSGTRFARIPEVLEGTPRIIERFMEQVRVEPEKWRAREGDLNRLASGASEGAAQLTHHDLANEGYSASRLWAGYVRALEEAGGKRPPRKLTEKLEWARGVSFDWQDELLRRQRQPAYQQFQIARRSIPTPQYPPVPDGPTIIERHATSGLPRSLRVLLVDDEFDKGLASVLVKTLFGDVEFTSKGPGDNEWLYSEERDRGRWIRLVCVKNTTAAYNWLKYWSECDARTSGAAGRDYNEWLRTWAAVVGAGVGTSPEDIKDVFRWGRAALDSQSARPAKPITVILLDLRLQRGEPEVAYDPTEFASLEFRGSVKEARPDLPVILFTASRQALNYAAAMSQAGLQDGWLTKEAPDVPTDDSNSSRAVQYLLQRLHLFSVSGEWYRPELGWSSDQMLEFNQLWQRLDRDQLLESVGKTAQHLFDSAKAGRTQVIEHGVRFFGFVKSRMPAPACAVMPRLAARKLAVACLLHTANWEREEPRWDARQFQTLLPQGPDGKEKDVDGIYHVVNFTRDLWLPGRESPLNRLLIEEYKWLLDQEFGQNSSECKGYIQRCMEMGAGREDRA